MLTKSSPPSNTTLLHVSRFEGRPSGVRQRSENNAVSRGKWPGLPLEERTLRAEGSGQREPKRGMTLNLVLDELILP